MKCSVLAMLKATFQSNSSMIHSTDDPVAVIYGLLCSDFDLSFIFKQGGIYVLNIFDSQIFVVIFEALAVSWGYSKWF